MPPPSPVPASPLRTVRWLKYAVTPLATANPRVFALPSTIVVRALAPTIVTLDVTSNCLVVEHVPAGTFIVSSPVELPEAVSAERMLGQACVVVLHDPPSPVLVTFQVS